MSDFRINFEDFPDAARIQDLIALLVHSKRKFVDFALDRIEWFGVAEDTVYIALKRIWLREVL